MTDDGLEKIVINYNKYLKNFRIIDYRIGDNISYGSYLKIRKKIKNRGSVYSSDNYFIFAKNENKCIGIVQVLPGDLHIYILPKYRKQYYAYNAMQNNILPHIRMMYDYNGGSPTVRVTVNNLASYKLIEKLGFTMTTECPDVDDIHEKFMPITAFLEIYKIPVMAQENEFYGNYELNYYQLTSDFRKTKKHLQKINNDIIQKIEILKEYNKYLNIIQTEEIHLDNIKISCQAFISDTIDKIKVI